MATDNEDDQFDKDSDDASGDGVTDSDFVVSEENKSNRGSMFMFALILAGVGATYLMMMRTGPRTAAAAPEAAKAQTTITSFLSKGTQNITSMEQMLRGTEKVVQQFIAYPSMTQIPLSSLQTNPFRHVALKPAAVSENAATEKKRREEERLAALKSVQSLQLMSIMHSDSRRACMINNTLYQEGQTLEGFTIEKISPTAVIVRAGAYRFELRMQK